MLVRMTILHEYIFPSMASQIEFMIASGTNEQKKIDLAPVFIC